MVFYFDWSNCHKVKRVSRMNGRMRSKNYEILVKRDGEYCRCCQKLVNEASLVIDHKDNDNSNNSISNLQILCRTCNYQKNPRKPIDSESEVVNVNASAELQLNRTKEPKFRQFVFHMINEQGEISRQELIASGAEELGISIITAGRYLAKLCSSRGILEQVNRSHGVCIRYKPAFNDV